MKRVLFVLASASLIWGCSNFEKQFVTLTDAVPDAILEIRYYGTYNFVGERIDGYLQPTALLTREAATALKDVSDDVMSQGYRLKIYDAYRPQKGVDHFVRWASDVTDSRMKEFFYPDLDKGVLFEQDYIMAKSGHTRGSTVDLTLFDMTTEKEVDMGGTFDWFGEESHPDFCGNPETGEYTGGVSSAGRSITAEQFENRMILRRAMLRHGFKPLDSEWWHFTLKDEPYPDTYFNHPVKQFKAACKKKARSGHPTVGNPYLPLWEHIPDGEPYVFDDPDNPGRRRVYIYGSHDTERTQYCGRDQVVWSAPVDSLWNWRRDGVILEVTKDRDGNLLYPDGLADILYAPDVCCVKNADGTSTYYLYPNNMGWKRNSMVAKSSRPDGPFQVINWSSELPYATEGIMGFDPAVFVDDDGRVYGYWGFCESNGAELDPSTMATLKPGTEIVKDMVSNLNQEGVFRFFEASSIRKIKDKYVFIYSRWTPDGEFGLPNTNYTLAYAYSDKPLGPWTYGGTIIDARGRDVDEDGKPIATATPSGNTHGSICEINGQWYVFYHRQTGLNEYSRQAMVSPISVSVEEGPGGKVFISEGEYTSQGFALDGLNPMERHYASIACWYTGPRLWRKHGDDFFTGPYVEPLYGTSIVHNTSGSIVGYKYFNFSRLKAKNPKLTLGIVPEGVDGTITVWADRPWASQGGKELGKLALRADMPREFTKITVPLPGLTGLKGRHAVYFSFDSPAKDVSLCTLESLVFE